MAGFLVGARATKYIPSHPSATTGTEDRLTLSWFASLKRHECASLNSFFFSVISVITFFSDIMRNRNIQIEIKILNFMNGLRILSGNFQGMMRGVYN